MLVENLGSERNRFLGGNGAVGHHVQGQLIVVGVAAHAGILHVVAHLVNGGVDGVGIDGADGSRHSHAELLVCELLVTLLRHVSTAAVKDKLHVEALTAGQGSDVVIGIQDLDVGILLDVTCGDIMVAGHVDDHSLGAGAMQLSRNALDVEHNLGHVLHDTGNGGKLVQDAVDLDAGHCHAGQGGQQDTTEGVTEGNTVAPFQRLYDKGTGGTVNAEVFSRNIRLLDLNHSK